MSPGQNGWEDSPEDESETLAAWEADDEQWRGAEYPDSWPEYLAGPEYWLNKRRDSEA